MTIPTRRILNMAGFLACSGMMGFAFYAQYVLELEPCPLCIFQRVAVIALGMTFLAAALHNPQGWGRRVYAALIVIAAGAGGAVATRHVWLQNLPPDKVPSCGPGLGYMLDNFPVGDAMRMVFTGSGECANVVWRLFGLSMPTWVLIGVGTLGAFGVWNSLRSEQHQL
ncbi:disulfide bond formation protein B [Gammaproteobacteria bacterium]|nr:disulfide bond formation protein B [Gammaproteobacteria bacterium]